MLGTAVGDALGRPVEGHRQVSESYLAEISVMPRSKGYSDDTALTIWLAESLLACDGFDGFDMAYRFAEGYSHEPYRGYGSNITNVFHQVLQGANWKRAAQGQFGGEGSYGNGGAMRVAPVALWEHGNLKETARLARKTCEVTHTHPIGVEGAMIQAVAAHHALRNEIDRAELLRDLKKLVKTEQVTEKLETLERALELEDDLYARLHLGNWVSADKSVLTSVYCFLVAPDFEETIIRAIRMGGDTDTIAAMAGALAGARHGLEAIPQIWRDVEGADHLMELADGMYQRVQQRGT